MKILPVPLEFEWDRWNINKNYLKHNVTNRETEEVFTNKPSYIFFDEKHSVLEKRYMIWGATDKGRKLSIFFTTRKDKIRVISARDMHKKERRTYEEKIKTDSQI